MAMIKKTVRIVVLTLITLLVVMLPVNLILNCGERADRLRISNNDALFDTPRKPRGLTLPPGVEAFFSSLSTRFEAHDLDGVMSHFSDAFLHQGKSKPEFREHISRSFFIKHLSSMKIYLLKFTSHGQTAEIAGFIETDLGYLLQSSEVLPLLEGSMLRRENDQWKLYGNQRKTPFGMFKDFISITGTMAPADVTLYRRLLPAQFAMPKTPTVAVNMTEHQRLALPFTPYRLGRISLLANYAGEEGWYDLTLPETSWPPVNFGQTVGYPKYVVDSIQLRKTRTGWWGEARDKGRLILSIKFTPDPSVESWLERVSRPSCLTLVRMLLPAYRQKPFYIIKPVKPRQADEARLLISRAGIASYVTPSITQVFGKMRVTVDPTANWAGLFPRDGVMKANVMKFSGDINLKHHILNDEYQAP